MKSILKMRKTEKNVQLHNIFIAYGEYFLVVEYWVEWARDVGQKKEGKQKM